MTVRYESDGPVTVVTIDRPEVANAIDRLYATGRFSDIQVDAQRREGAVEHWAVVQK